MACRCLLLQALLEHPESELCLLVTLSIFADDLLQELILVFYRYLVLRFQGEVPQLLIIRYLEGALNLVLGPICKAWNEPVLHASVEQVQLRQRLEYCRFRLAILRLDKSLRDDSYRVGDLTKGFVQELSGRVLEPETLFGLGR